MAAPGHRLYDFGDVVSKMFRKTIMTATMVMITTPMHS